MPKSARSFDRITIAAPCDADWEAMSGNDQVRFCEHCHLNVTNLSTMTRREAMRLVERSQGRLCVRYVQRANGDVLTKEIPERLHRISRRASRIVAGAFSATLSVASVAAQTRSTADSSASQTLQAVMARTPTNQEASISGVVKDPNGAVVSQSTVTLTNPKTNLSFVFVTQDDGAYKFSLLEAGSYNLSVEATGFSPKEIGKLEVSGTSNQTVDVDLSIAIVRAEVEVRADTPLVMSVQGGIGIREPSDPLAKAAFKNDLDTARQLIPVTDDVNKWDEFTNTNALSYAIENHNREMVRMLLSVGASANSRNKYGRTPLMYLNEGATVELVQDLIVAGADANARDESDVTVLSLAARAGSFAVFKELIAAGARIDAKDDQGNTVLMSAAENEDPAVVKFLLAAGVDVAARNSGDGSALMIAAHSGKSETLKAMIDAGGALNLKQEQMNAALMGAADTGDPRVVKVLIDAGANVNAKEDDGTTVLMDAAQDGKPETVKILIDAGADLNAVDEDGWTALMHAEDVESVRILLDAGANLSARNKNGKTALSMAIEAKQDDIVQLLKSRGAPE